MEIEDFDWEFYLMFNADVGETFGHFKYAALMHYKQHGKDENRIINEKMLFTAYPYMLYFDHEYYRLNNPDLSSIKDRYKLINHYIFQGSKEGRNIHFNTSIYPYFNFSDYKSKHKEPLISIIMPVYNRQDLLHHSIDSIINQSYKNIELIIIDDASNRKTKEILSSYKDSRISLLTNATNYGCYPSVNMALNMCNGTYITVHGSDDISLKDRYSKLVDIMIDKKLLMSGNYILRSHLDDFRNINIYDNMDIFTKIITQNLINKKHNYECCKPLVSLGTLMYHRSVFDHLGTYENIRKGGDMVFFEKFLYNYENIKFDDVDCSHRYLTKCNKGNTYQLIDEILYLSAEMNHENITQQNIKFDINVYRKKLYL